MSLNVMVHHVPARFDSVMCDKTKHLAPRIAPSLEFVEPSKALVCTLTVYASDMQLARFESSLGTGEESRSS